MIQQFLTMLGHPVAVVCRKPVRPELPPTKVYWPAQLSQDPDERADVIEGIADGYNSVYCNLNPLKSECLDRIYPPGVSVRNSMIEKRTRLLLDIDAHGSPLDDAEQQKDAIKAHLGWPVLIETYSGNGFGLIYDCDLPVNATATVRDFLLTLKRKFSAVDASVTNANRLTRLIGTYNVRNSTRVLTRILNDTNSTRLGPKNMFAFA